MTARTVDKTESRERIRDIRAQWAWWDPIGVLPDPADPDGPRDEYDMYLAPTLRLLERGASIDELSEFLDKIAFGRMGLSTVTPTSREFAARLINWFAAGWANTRVPGA